MILFFLITFFISTEISFAENRDKILVVIDVDPVIKNVIDFNYIENKLFEENNNIIRFDPLDSKRSLFIQKIEEKSFEDAIAIAKKSFNELTSTLVLKILQDPANRDKCFISGVFINSVNFEKKFVFLDREIEKNKDTIVKIIKDELIRKTSLSSKIDLFKPVSICFIIDNSGSMVKNDNDFNPVDLFYNPEQTARAGAVRLIFNRLTSNDEVAFIFFSGEVETVYSGFKKIKDPRSQKITIEKVISRIGMKPGTDIEAALQKTVKLVKNASYSNVYVIFLSDGNPTQGEKDFNKLRTFVRENFPKIPFFVIGLEGAREIQEKGYALEKSFLRDLATDTKGLFRIISLKDSLESRYGAVVRAVEDIFNVIRKEETILDSEPASKKVVKKDSVVYEWDFVINSDCSEFTILLEPWKNNFNVELLDPSGKILNPSSFSVVSLVNSAILRVMKDSCKGKWKLSVKVPQL